MARNTDGLREPRVVLGWQVVKVLSVRTSTNEGIAWWHFPWDKWFNKLDKMGFSSDWRRRWRKLKAQCLYTSPASRSVTAGTTRYWPTTSWVQSRTSSLWRWWLPLATRPYKSTWSIGCMATWSSWRYPGPRRLAPRPHRRPLRRCYRHPLRRRRGSPAVLVNPFTADPVKASHFAIYWSKPPFLIFHIRALRRSGMSAGVPECQKLKTVA